MSRAPIALAGIGKIARDAHVPALEDSPDWELAATLSRSGGIEGVRNFEDMDAFLAADTGIGAISLALPPGPRFAYALRAMEAGLHVAIEKPPAMTLTQARALVEAAEAADVTLHVTWHSRMGRAVEAAAERLANATIRRVRVDWREDVRQFHPDQDWVWEAGNLGVFDPGINAFSILTRILPGRFHLRDAEMVIPEGRETPISAEMDFDGPQGAEMSMTLDWAHRGDPVWDIEVETEGESLTLGGGGAELRVVDEDASVVDHAEYPGVYARFAELVQAGASETDLRPMELVADAFLLARRREGAPFTW